MIETLNCSLWEVSKKDKFTNSLALIKDINLSLKMQEKAFFTND